MMIQRLFDLAVQRHRAGQLREAERLYRQVLAQQPDHVGATHYLGLVAHQLGHDTAAIELIGRAIALNAGSAEVHGDLGAVLRNAGRLDEAIATYRNAVAIKPDYADAHFNLGLALKDNGQWEMAIAAYRQAIVLNANFPEAWSNLGNVLAEMGDFDQSIGAYRRAIALRPDFAQARDNLGADLLTTGQLDEAITTWRNALAANPRNAAIHSHLLLALQFHSRCDATILFQEHLRWNREHAEPLRQFIQPHANDRSARRRLRIGYVSADFRDHPVGRFLLPLLENHDHQRFEIFCYSGVRRPDDVTAQLRSRADHWREIALLGDEQLAGQIRADAIDILVDLAGHTDGNRLLVFARKPAPIQVSYLGYPGTTGLGTIDSRLTDAIADPPALTERQFTETLHRLPHVAWCFAEPRESVPLAAPPVESRGCVTFGSFNHLAKVSPEMLGVWANVLRAVPGSRLLLKAAAFGAGSIREHVRLQFAVHGIDSSRLDLRPQERDYDAHLRAYGDMDVALDTFPYHGTTTTCDALWMGVPVVTLAGTTHAARVGVSLLSSIGLAELVATSVDQYARIAIALANDLPRLKALRQDMRRRMLASPLMDAPTFARNVEAAYMEAWQRWCDKAPQGVVVQHEIRDAQSAADLGAALRSQGRLGEAAMAFERAIALQPAFPQAHNNLGVILCELGWYQQAASAFSRATELNPGYAKAHANLASVLRDLDRVDESLAAASKAISLDSRLASAHNNLGVALADQGRISEALTCYDRAMALEPANAGFHSNRLYALHLHGDFDAAAILAEHRRWNERHAAPLKNLIQPHRNVRDADRRLKIGYVSRDLRMHPVGRFLLPLLEQRDRSQFEIFCYADHRAADSLSDRLRQNSDHWREIAGRSDAEVADLVRRDSIDVLVDLMMHTVNNRLLVFAQKPAPVQVSYLAYCSTTGLETIDYRFTDRHLDPPESEASVAPTYSEQSISLPDSYYCYVADESDCEPGPLPALSNGHVTFGSFNSFSKVSKAALDAWCRLLGEIPNSRLLLYARPGSCRQNVADRFERGGVDPRRVTFVNFSPREEYFRQFQRVDVALDSFPCAGATTTCDALWMGVPVVTLAGRTAIGRTGASLLSNVGLPELIAHSVDEYVQCAKLLATDVAQLTDIRGELRQRMRESSLMNAPRFARGVESAYRTMWRKWCS